MEIPVQFNYKGKNLLGVFHVAEQKAHGSPTIILCYGLNGNRVENHRMSVLHGRYAEKCGVNLFRFDYSGLGVSDGEFWEMSIVTKVEEVIASINFVKGCSQNEKQTYILLGFSDGARVAMDVVKECKDILGICMWNPIFFPLPIAKDKKGLRLTREPRTKKMVFPFLGVWGGLEHLSEQKNMGNVMEEFLNFEGHKLAVFGEKDEFTYTGCQAFMKENETAKYKSIIKVIPNANHLFSYSAWVEEVIQITLAWALDVGNVVRDN